MNWLKKGISPIYGKPDVLALVGTAVTIGVHLAIKATSDKPSFWFIAGACTFWIIFVLVRATQNPNAFREWGFRADNILAASVLPAILFCLAAVAMGGYALASGWFRFPPHMLACFALYPIWGVIQQFLALAIVVGNLERIAWLRRRMGIVVLVGSTIFALVHVYDWRLAVATFGLELVVIPLYLRHRNLWPLGVLQGWLGALFYLWILNIDIWAETFRL